MTLAPRVEVFTQLACSRVHHSYNHTTSTLLEAPFQYGRPELISLTFMADLGDKEDDPRQLPSLRCVSDPAVQAGAGEFSCTARRFES
jgi:hypothetical protein